jgi:hypothetical protein
LPGLSHRRTARRRGSNKFAADSSLEEAGFEPSVPRKAPAVVVLSVLVRAEFSDGGASSRGDMGEPRTFCRSRTLALPSPSQRSSVLRPVPKQLFAAQLSGRPSWSRATISGVCLSPLELAHCFGRSWVALRRRSNSTSEQHRSNPGDRYQRCYCSSGQKAVRPALHITQDIGPLDHWISFLNFSARAAGQAAPIRSSSEYGRRELRNDFRISESGYV